MGSYFWHYRKMQNSKQYNVLSVFKEYIHRKYRRGYNKNVNMSYLSAVQLWVILIFFIVFSLLCLIYFQNDSNVTFSFIIIFLEF